MTVVFMDPAPTPSDGFDQAAQYQMVPVGGVRGMALWVQADEPEDVIVYCANPNKAGLSGLKTIQGHAVIRGSGYFVKRDSAISFNIRGRDPGPTTLIVESVSGKMRHFLLLSVKPQLRRTYQLAVLSDPIHVPAKDLVGANLAANIQGAAQIWLRQANVVLDRIGPLHDVVVPIDLGNPIQIDDPIKFTAIVTAKTFEQVSDLYIYCTWDIVASTNPLAGGYNLLNVCFIENQFIGRPGELLCAHEVGHALGLQHSMTRSDLLMTGSTIFHDVLDVHDIETANRL